MKKYNQIIYDALIARYKKIYYRYEKEACKPIPNKRRLYAYKKLVTDIEDVIVIIKNRGIKNGNQF